MFKLSRDERDFVQKVSLFSQYSPEVIRDVFISMSIATLTEICSTQKVVLPFIGEMSVSYEAMGKKSKSTVEVSPSHHLKDSIKTLYAGEITDAEEFLLHRVQEGAQKKINLHTTN